MNKIELLDMLNHYALEGDEKILVKTINYIIDSNRICQYKDIIFKFISSTQYYGFLEYLSDEMKQEYFEFDLLTSSSYKGKQVNYYNSGQLSLLFEMLENDKMFISAPTSFGKTSLITEMLLENVKRFNNVLMIIPTNSLIEELFLKLNILNKERELSYKISTQPVFVKNVRNILILTPERFLVLVESINLNDFDLIIMDETYKIVDYNNKRVSDFVNRRSFRFRKVADLIGHSKTKVIYLSPYTYILKDSMIRFLKKYNIKRVNRKIDYVTHEVIKMDSSIDFQSFFSKGGYKKKHSISKKTARLISELNPDKVIVYVKSYAQAYSIVNEMDDIKIAQNDERFNLFLNHMKLNYSIDNIPKWKVIEGLEKGIGVYISPLPRYIKKEIVNLYDRGILKTLIVTTAFTEGINTDAEHLIITSLISGSNYNKLTELDLLNTVGRAGRFTKNSVGKVYCITEEIFKKVINVKEVNQVNLENLNYVEVDSRIRNDYELDMMDEEYLNDTELEEKYILQERIQKEELTSNDLNISLNVSNKWKICLYEYFKTLSSNQVVQVNSIIRDLLYDNSARLKAINFIFVVIKHVLSKENINPFPLEIYEIKPFDNKGGFVWGRMYALYSTCSTKTMIRRNIEYITKKINHIIEEYPVNNNFKLFERYSRLRNEFWTSNYIDKNLNIKYNKFYTETFKFISSVIQYRIPYYVTYFISVYKLFLNKNNGSEEIIKLLDINSIIMLFENNTMDKEYSVLVDYGISNDVLNKLRDNNIKLANLNNIDTFDFLDDYEKLILKEAYLYL